MDKIIGVFTSNPPELIIASLLFLAGGFVLKLMTDKAIKFQFDRQTKTIGLALERRSRFEEMILTERYDTVSALLSRLTRIASDIRRLRQGIPVDGLMRGNDIVPLTEVYEDLAARRHVLTERFHPNFNALATLLIDLAKANTAEELKEIEKAYQRLLTAIQTDMEDVFGLSDILWPDAKPAQDQAAS